MEPVEIVIEKCPECGNVTLRVYYSEFTDDKIGAACTSCRFSGYYAAGELVPMKA